MSAPQVNRPAVLLVDCTKKNPGIQNKYRENPMAEKEGFEPSIPFWGIHDFQSCALGQLRDFSKCAVRISLLIIHYLIVFVKLIFSIFCKILRSSAMVLLDKRMYFHYNIKADGVWRSLVSRLVRVQEASGSNPDTPTREAPKFLEFRGFYLHILPLFHVNMR